MSTQATTEKDAEGVEWTVFKCRECGSMRRGLRVVRLPRNKFLLWQELQGKIIKLYTTFWLSGIVLTAAMFAGILAAYYLGYKVWAFKNPYVYMSIFVVVAACIGAPWLRFDSRKRKEMHALLVREYAARLGISEEEMQRMHSYRVLPEE